MNKTTWLAALALISSPVFAEVVNVEMIDLGSGQSTGTVMISSSEYGAVFTPELKGLPTGTHGFHVHVNGSCDSITKDGKIILGGAAGGHYDPENTGKHGFPWTDDNHLGDLPSLYVNAHGVADQPVMAPELH